MSARLRWHLEKHLFRVSNHAGVDIQTCKDVGWGPGLWRIYFLSQVQIPHHIAFFNLETNPQSLWLINLSWLKPLFYFSTFVSSTLLCNLKVLCICANLYGAVGTWWTWTGSNCHHLWRKSKSNWPKSKPLTITLQLTIKPKSNSRFPLADEAPILFL